MQYYPLRPWLTAAPLLSFFTSPKTKKGRDLPTPIHPTTVASHQCRPPRLLPTVLLRCAEFTIIKPDGGRTTLQILISGHQNPSDLHGSLAPVV